jgi:hypothetical protein
MKAMKKIYSVAAVIAALGALTACSKEHQVGNDDGRSSAVRIGIVYGEASNSRAVGTPIVGSGTHSPLSSGHILFYNSATGLIDKHIGLNEPAITPNESIEDLEANNVVVLGVSGNVDRCMIVFNDNDLITEGMVGRRIDEVKGEVVLASVINNDEGTIANIPLEGDERLRDAEGVNDEDEPYSREVVMTVRALGARLQMGAISAGLYNPEGGQPVTIDAFTVEGIYITSVNSQMTLGRVADPTLEVNYMQDVTKYVAPGVDGSGYAVSTVGEGLADIPTEGKAAGDPLAVAPSTTAGRMWVYNLFPTSIPHIVVRLSGISYTIGEGQSQNLPGEKWLTVKSYHFDTGDGQVTQFKPNEVYTLNNLQFNYSHLTDLPETQAGDVRVFVTVAPWLNNDIHWGD